MEIVGWILLVLGIVLAYISIGSIIMFVLQDREWLELQPMGYIVFPIFWIFIIAAIIPYAILVSIKNWRNQK